MVLSLQYLYQCQSLKVRPIAFPEAVVARFKPPLCIGEVINILQAQIAPYNVQAQDGKVIHCIQNSRPTRAENMIEQLEYGRGGGGHGGPKIILLRKLVIYLVQCVVYQNFFRVHSVFLKRTPINICIAMKFQTPGSRLQYILRYDLILQCDFQSIRDYCTDRN